MPAKRTSKNQLPLPKKIADLTLESIREKMEQLHVVEEDVSRAVQWAGKRKTRSGKNVPGIEWRIGIVCRRGKKSSILW